MSRPEPFLHQIARVYVDNERDELIDYCFVMPNKRSGVFLGKYFGEQLKADGGTALLPEITTISDFVTSLNSGVEASRTELLLLLYNVYASVLKRHSSAESGDKSSTNVDFNKFQYWGDILLSDFSDVDRYLVDAKMLFKNVASLKEISSNFLTPEQIEVIKQYWKEDLVPEPVKEFWRHAVHTTGKGSSDGKHNVAGFIKLWQVMFEIYTEFRAKLTDAGLTYSGMAYRHAVDHLNEIDADELPYKRYIFVGFNVLSKSEKMIFKALQQMGIADFYWDNGSPQFDVDANRGARFIHENISEFPSLYDSVGTRVDHFPDIEVIGIPSTVGQAHYFPRLIKRMIPQIFDGEGNIEDTLLDTAVVLPDENLTQPLLNSMPEEIPVVNVTMGFSLRHTPVAGLLSNIISLQLRARELKSEDTFYYEDVMAVLSHPIIRRFFSSTCDAVIRHINENRLFNIPFAFFQQEPYSELLPIFNVVRNASDPEAVIKYLSQLFHWLIDLFESHAPISIEEEIFDIEDEVSAAEKEGNDANGDGDGNIDDEIDDEDEESGGHRNRGDRAASALSIMFLRSFLDAIDELNIYRERYLKNIYLEDKTVFHLVERIAGNATVNYEGMPLKGLQVMGVLESRSLDFGNLIMMSMNERIFPRKHYSKSFIPNALRKGYEMATIEHQEAIYAYYFYRLISRAGRVTLLYDSRTNGVMSGEMSRYISQLRYQSPPGKIKFLEAGYRMQAPEVPTVSVAKSEEVMAKLQRYLDDENPRFLSANAINSFINCPLQFYLTHIERYYPEDELNDYMDESTYGLIIHEVAEKIYTDARGDSDSIAIDERLLTRISDEHLVGTYLERAIKKLYLRVDPDDPRPLHGDAAIYHKVMMRTLRKMFEREGELNDTSFVKGEEPQYTRLKVSDRFTINLSYRIDRVDNFTDENGEKGVRLIDYKTGADDITAPNVKALFDSNRRNRPKAILQLLLYANAYAQKEKFDGSIQPFIYKLRTLATDRLKPLTVEKQPIVDYRDINEEYLQLLDETLADMFDPARPFVSRPSDHTCKYCKFTEICRPPER